MLPRSRGGPSAPSLARPGGRVQNPCVRRCGERAEVGNSQENPCRVRCGRGARRARMRLGRGKPARLRGAFAPQVPSCFGNRPTCE
jgi:hypothetical protein